MDKDKSPVIERLPQACPGRIEVPTEKEREALAAMRAIKRRARELKGYLGEQKTPGPDKDGRDIGEMRRELTRLKKDWEKWEKNRRQAARERMILLGHEEGSE